MYISVQYNSLLCNTILYFLMLKVSLSAIQLFIVQVTFVAHVLLNVHFVKYANYAEGKLS